MKAIEIDCGAGSFYDRIAGLYDITFKFNGYSRSLEKYLEEHLPPLPAQARVLDAGCGTGLLTLALLKVLDQPLRITAIDLSSSSLATASRAVAENSGRTQSVRFAQANLLQLPFADDSFDLIMTSGVLEYVPLSEGFHELARVIRPGGYVLHLPVRPSPASKLLEVMFRFKAHPPREVEKQTTRHFRVVNHHRFPPFEPIGWTKTAVLAQKF
ncbi:MAG TPA: methyltransferase domain-containing protein [Pyrinomonadaceae bacterium]|jgi:demethylmenaquinone methyltransferase/2-methoxy-6-polyprenyl-1,4-benzoquinol methylase